MNTRLAAELARMAEEDQRVRKTLSPDASVMADPSAWWSKTMAMNRVDVANTNRLREIVDEHGWPGRSLVGEEGAAHAWLLAQHASAQLDFQRRVLDLLTAAVAAGEATPRQLAYLTDRVRMLEGKEQIYGTQLHGHPARRARAHARRASWSRGADQVVAQDLQNVLCEWTLKLAFGYFPACPRILASAISTPGQNSPSFIRRE